MAKKKQPWRRRLEKFAMLALHAYPTLRCRGRSLTPGTPVAALFDLYRRELVLSWRMMPLWQRSLILMIWPPVIVLMAAGMTIAKGASVARRYRRGIFSQFTGQIRLAFCEGVVPLYFYSFELHEPRNGRRAGEYLLREQLKYNGLYRRLYRPCRERNQRAKILNNKRSLDQFCREHHLPTARLVAYVEDGSFSWADADRAALPQSSLFVKPWRERGGYGAERWIYQDGRFLGHWGHRLDPQGLTDHLAKLSRRASRWGSRRQPLVVQECLVNHPELSDLKAGALSTFRMYTAWNERGEVELLASTLRTSHDPASILDLAGHGALAARVHPATGILGPATDPTVLARAGWMEHHPFTNAPIAGRRIPFWRDALDLMDSAHRKVDAAFLIGWDIAITERGPVIVEGNKAPDIEIEQRLNGPWGNERFGALLLFHIAGETAGVADRARSAFAELPSAA